MLDGPFMRRTQRSGLFSLSFGALVAASGCARHDDATKAEQANAQATNTGLRMRVLSSAKRDVTQVSYEITDCETPGTVIASGVQPLLAQSIPGGQPSLDNNPLDENSRHAFADILQILDPGCYRVRATPLKADGSPSDVCHETWTPTDLTVIAGQITETLLVSQCDGVDASVLDTIVALNSPPSVLDLNFVDNKFSCSLKNELCVVLGDPDRDPIDVEFSVEDGCTAAEVSNTPLDDGTIQVCAEVSCGAPGKHPITVTAYDKLHQDLDGDGVAELVRFDDWFNQIGYPHTSSTSLELWTYLAKNEECDTCVSSDSDLEFVLLQDLSSSFSDDLPVLSDLAPALFDALAGKAGSIKAGVASYVDKPVGSLGGAGDYVFKVESTLSSDRDQFISTIGSFELKSGQDVPESQLDALFQTAINTGRMGFNDGTTRIVMLTTDAPFHESGDCTETQGCTGPNNLDDVVTNEEDYVSRQNVADALTASKIFPIFAVTSSELSFYEQFVKDDLDGRGRVVELSSDSSNIVEIIADAVLCD